MKNAVKESFIEYHSVLESLIRLAEDIERKKIEIEIE